jgi:hypothetical protein
VPPIYQPPTHTHTYARALVTKKTKAHKRAGGVEGKEDEESGGGGEGEAGGAGGA